MEATEKTAAGGREPASAAKGTSGPRECPIAAALQVVGERWTLLAIREMNYGVHRFEQIFLNTGMSRDILADRLRKLESAGVIDRRQYSERPPRFEYHLTEAGEELRPVLLSMALWGQKWVGGAPVPGLAHHPGRPLQADWVCRDCGEVITRENLSSHRL